MNKPIIWDRERIEWLNSFRVVICLHKGTDDAWVYKLSANPGSLRESIDNEMISQSYANERTKRELKTPEELVALLEITNGEQAKGFYAQMLIDYSEEDVAVRKEAKKVLTEGEVEGDSYGVPMMADIVERLVKKIQNLEVSLDSTIRD